MSISHVAFGTWVEASTSPQTIPLPAGHVAGDILYLFLIQSSASGVTWTPPGGWSSVARNSNATRTMTIEVYRKVDNGSESNPSVSCSSATSGWGAAIGSWRGVNRTTPEDATAVLSDAAAAATFQPTGITTNTDFALVISFVGTKDDNALNFNTANGFTARASGASYDGTTGNGSDYAIAVGDKSTLTHGAQTCPTWNESANSTDAWVALTLALVPANDVTATPGAKSLSTSTFAPTVVLPKLVTPGTIAETLTTFAPSALAPRLATPGKLSLVTAAFAPTVLLPKLVTPSTLALVTAKFASTVLTPRLVTPPTLAAALAEFAPSVLVSKLVVPGVAPLTLTTFAPTVGVSSNLVVTPGTIGLSLATFAPTVATPRVVVPGTLAEAIVAYAPSVVIPARVVPSTKALVIVGYPPTVQVGSAAQRVPTLLHARIASGGAGDGILAWVALVNGLLRRGGAATAVLSSAEVAKAGMARGGATSGGL